MSLTLWKPCRNFPFWNIKVPQYNDKISLSQKSSGLEMVNLKWICWDTFLTNTWSFPRRPYNNTCLRTFHWIIYYWYATFIYTSIIQRYSHLLINKCIIDPIHTTINSFMNYHSRTVKKTSQKFIVPFPNYQWILRYRYFCFTYQMQTIIIFKKCSKIVTFYKYWPKTPSQYITFKSSGFCCLTYKIPAF